MKLRMENARLKEELDRVASLTSKFLGRPFMQMLQGTPPISMSSSLDLSMGGMGRQALGNPSLDLAIISRGASEMSFRLPAPVMEMERPMMAGMTARAMDEVIRLTQVDDHVWAKIPGDDGRETLNVDTYDNIFSKPGSSFRAADIHVEGSRDSALVFLSAVALIDVFMDSSKRMEFFPSIVANARTIDVLVHSMSGRSESLILMYEELHMMTPVVLTREFSFLRYYRQIDQGLWTITNVSVDLQRDVHFGMPPRSRRLPSGCLVAD